MPDELAVEAAGLRKSYGGVLALAGVDLRVPVGSRCALLGPNGAGKTTTVRILATLTRPDAGHARVAGCDISTGQHLLRRRIGLTGQFTGLDGQQTGEENLRMVARLSGIASEHPYQPQELSQGCLRILQLLEKCLLEITGMDVVTLQPAAGAQGELTGLLLIRAYHEKRRRRLHCYNAL